MKVPISTPSAFSLPRFIAWLFAIISITYFFYSLKFAFSPPPCVRPPDDADPHIRADKSFHLSASMPLLSSKPGATREEKTGLSHIVFGIAASAKLWDRRKEYIKLWWKPQLMRGVVWLDRPVKNDTDRHLLPKLLISSNTSRLASFNYL